MLKSIEHIKILALAVAAILAAACQDDEIIKKAEDARLEPREIGFDLSFPEDVTRGAFTTTANLDELNVTCIMHNADGSGREVYFENVTFKKQGALYKSDEPYYWLNEGKQYDFYVNNANGLGVGSYMPTDGKYNDEEVPNVTIKTDKFTGFDDHDVESRDLVADSKLNVPDDNNAPVPLKLKHILTAIKFRTSSDCYAAKLNSITIYAESDGVYDYTTNSYIKTSGVKAFTKVIDKDIAANQDLTSDDFTFLMLPQAMRSINRMEISVTYEGEDDEEIYNVPLPGTWPIGKVVTYNINATKDMTVQQDGLCIGLKRIQTDLQGGSIKIEKEKADETSLLLYEGTLTAGESNFLVEGNTFLEKLVREAGSGNEYADNCDMATKNHELKVTVTKTDEHENVTERVFKVNYWFDYMEFTINRNSNMEWPLATRTTEKCGVYAAKMNGNTATVWSAHGYTSNASLPNFNPGGNNSVVRIYVSQEVPEFGYKVTQGSITDMSAWFYTYCFDRNIKKINTPLLLNKTKELHAVFGWSNLEVITPTVLNKYGPKLKKLEEFVNHNQSLKTIDVSQWNVSNCTSLSGIFEHCYNITKIDGLDKWTPDNVTDYSRLFNFLSHLDPKWLKITTWNTSKAKHMGFLFSRTSYLSSYKNRTLDISNIDTRNLESVESMFQHCYFELKLGKNFVLSQISNEIGTSTYPLFEHNTIHFKWPGFRKWCYIRKNAYLGLTEDEINSKTKLIYEGTEPEDWP